MFWLVSGGYSLSYPVLHSIWLHISADPSQTIAIAMLLRTIPQTVSPATAQIPDPWWNVRVKAVYVRTRGVGVFPKKALPFYGQR